jgi:hypothetical protein
MRADWTLSLLTLKPGLFTALGRDLAGEVWIDDLGVADEEPADSLAGRPRRAASGRISCAAACAAQGQLR